MYNAAHWNGKKWELLQIQFYTFCGQVHTGAYPIDAILTMSETEVWFASNSQITIWKNNVQQNIMCLPASAYKIWAVNGNAIYTVGPIGQIDFYNGNTWTTQSSGTTIDLRDVWGTPDGSVVWASGYSNDNSQSVLLMYNGTQWNTIWTRQGGVTPPYGDLVTSVWGIKHLFTATNLGVYTQDITGIDTARQSLSIDHFPYCIGGSAENNVAVVGDFGMIWHYNGTDWKLLNETNLDQPLYSVAVSTNMIVAVGSDYTVFPSQAFILVGRRE